MASFHTVRLACFDGKSQAFKKFNANTGYKAQGTHPNKVSIPSLSFYCFVFSNLDSLVA